MTITREQVADLREGDVVELCNGKYTIRGPLENPGDDSLRVHIWVVRDADGSPYLGHIAARTLTVVSRAPRPLYVNHDRTEPVPGDVVRDADDDHKKRWWWYRATSPNADMPWSYWDNQIVYCRRYALPGNLLLLVDGETGQVVR